MLSSTSRKLLVWCRQERAARYMMFAPISASQERATYHPPLIWYVSASTLSFSTLSSARVLESSSSSASRNSRCASGGCQEDTTEHLQ